MKYRARIWPNGEFSVSYVNKTSPFENVKSNSTTVLPDESPWRMMEGDRLALIEEYGSIRAAMEALSPGYLDAAIGEVAHLGLLDVAKTHTRAPRGTKGITNYGRRMIRNGAYLLEEKCPKSGMGMITLTLPDLEPDDYVGAVAGWSEIMRQFLQWLGRRLRSAGAVPWVIGCCEVQEERMKKLGGLPLHAHLLIQTRTQDGFVFSIADIRNKWEEVVTRCGKLQNRYSWQSATRIETVNETAGDYISKYVSKGIDSKCLEEVQKHFRVPKTWWYGTNGIKTKIKSLIVTPDLEASSLIHWFIHNSPQLLVYRYDVVLDPMNDPRPIAWVGRFNREGRKVLKELGYNDAVPR